MCIDLQLIRTLTYTKAVESNSLVSTGFTLAFEATLLIDDASECCDSSSSLEHSLADFSAFRLFIESVLNLTVWTYNYPNEPGGYEVFDK